MHAVIGDPARGDETLDPKRSLLSEKHDGTFAERVAVPRRNLVPKPAALSFEQAACLPHRVADCLPDAVRPGRLQPGRDRAGPGSRRWGVDRADHAGPAAGLRVWVTSRTRRSASGRRARRRPGFRDRRPAARAGRRGHGDRRRGHLGPLAEVVASRWPGRDLRVDHRPVPPADLTGLLPAAVGHRLDHGHPDQLGQTRPLPGADRSPPADRPDPSRWPRPARGSPPCTRATCSERSFSPCPDGSLQGDLLRGATRACRGIGRRIAPGRSLWERGSRLSGDRSEIRSSVISRGSTARALALGASRTRLRAAGSLARHRGRRGESGVGERDERVTAHFMGGGGAVERGRPEVREVRRTVPPV